MENEAIFIKPAELISEDFLAKERENHFNITPGFRLATMAADKLGKDYKFNHLSLSFSVPVTDPKQNKFTIADNKVQALTVEDKECFSALFLNKELSSSDFPVDNNIDYNNKIIDDERMKAILPQKNELVMIDQIVALDEGKGVATRKINQKDYEGGDKFNKFRLIEMIGQAGSVFLLKDKNTPDSDKKFAAAFKTIDISFYPVADGLKIDDEIIIEVKPDSSLNSAVGIISKKEGEPVVECHFTYDKPRNVEIFKKLLK